jgi:hypothetical protein
LHVDADAELPGAVGLQGFKAVARQGPQVVQAGCRRQNFQPFVGLAVEPLKLDYGDSLLFYAVSFHRNARNTPAKTLAHRTTIGRDH